MPHATGEFHRSAMRWRAFLSTVAAVVLSACTVRPRTGDAVREEDLEAAGGWVLARGVPHVPQESEEDCGAAALASVLARWGVDAAPSDLVCECAVEGEPGLRAGALRDAARRRGLSAFVVEGRVSDLDHELRRGRPVIVGVVKSLAGATTSHYEVVVGWNAAEEKVAALDPALGLECDSFSDFATQWAAAEAVTLVVFRPGPRAGPPASGGP